MLIESTAHLPISLAMLQSVFNAPEGDEIWRILLRWLHFVAGITWIGLLYFFNLVNVPVQKSLDADTKKKVNPDLLGRALWYFRWGAVVTVLAGLMYYAMVILKADVTNANNIGNANVNIWYVLVMWLLYPIVLFAIEFLLIKKVPALTKDGRVFAIVMFVLVATLKHLDRPIPGWPGRSWTAPRQWATTRRLKPGWRRRKPTSPPVCSRRPERRLR